MQWINQHKRFMPSAFALTALVVFWVVGAAPGIEYLREANSTTAILTGLYLMLAVVAASIIVTVLALTDLARVTNDRRQRAVVRK